MPDAMSLVRPPNSNGRTIPLTFMFTFVTESHYLISYCNSVDHEIKAYVFEVQTFRILYGYMPIAH
jgi:hypothetical protein